jgi:hypothetical protein
MALTLVEDSAMKRALVIVSGLFIIFLLVAKASVAEEWIILGSKAQGMGGAGVASVRDGSATYWNPANLALVKRSPVKKEKKAEKPPAEAPPKVEDMDRDIPEKPAPPGSGKKPAVPKAPEKEEIRLEPAGNLQLLGSVSLVAAGGMARELDDIVDLYRSTDFQGIVNRINDLTYNPDDLETLFRYIDELEDLDRPGEGFYATAGAGLFFRYGIFGLSVYGLGYGGADPAIDFGTDGGAITDSTNFQEFLDFVPGGALNPGGQQLRTDLQPLVDQGILTSGRADNYAYVAQESGVDLSDPNLRGVLVDVARSSGTFPNANILQNRTGFEFRMLVLEEAAITLSIPIIPGHLAIGANAKIIRGESFYERFRAVDLRDGEDVLDEFIDTFGENSEVTYQFGVDVGITLAITPDLWIGVVGRNLNRPTFDFEGPGDLALEPQVRAGIAFRPIESLTLALDFDVTVNDSDILQGFESRLLGGGIEWRPIDNPAVGLAIRVGCYANLVSETNEDPVFTAGLGLRIWILQIDSSAAMTFSREDVEDDLEEEIRVPERSGATVNIGLNVPF